MLFHIHEMREWDITNNNNCDIYILVGARDLRTLWSRLVPHPCPENHVPKKFQVLDHVKAPVWNPGPKIEIPHPENHVLKVFRFRSSKPRVWKSRPQSWDPKSWKPYLKISQVFLGLGNPECKLQVSKNWGSHILKIMSKKFPGLGLGNPHRLRPKTKISRPENHVLKNSMSRFWWTPPVQANSRWPKTETVKNALFNVFKWVISGERQKLRQLRTPCSVCSNELFLGNTKNWNS